MSWAPEQGPLSQLAELIGHSLSNQDAIRVQAFHALEEARKVPDVNNYLSYLLVRSGNVDLAIRQAAGLLLKNNIRAHAEPREPHADRDYVKQLVLDGLRDQQAYVRNISATVITTIISADGVYAWPNLLPTLLNIIDAGDDENAVLGAFNALTKICEDVAKDLDEPHANQDPPSTYLVPRLLNLAIHPHARVRQDALFCLNKFALCRSQAFLVNIESFFNVISQLATDASPAVRKNVCTAIVTLVDVRPDKLVPIMDQMVSFMLYASRDDDEEVALESCEFFLATAEENDLRRALKPHLNQLVPRLLEGMVYSEMDIIVLGEDDDDADQVDKSEDIAPQHAKSKARGAVPDKSNGSRVANEGQDGQGQGGEDDDQDEDEDDEDDDDDDDDDYYTEWNFRKCSAATFDVLSVHFPNEIIMLAIPFLREHLVSQDWTVREAAVLALGALAQGCQVVVAPYLPDLIPYLLSLVKDGKPLVRQIACWCVGRYSSWAVEFTPGTEAYQKYFVSMLEGLLESLLDRNKRVQEAACSAFATFEEVAGNLLNPFLEHIVQRLASAFAMYQQRNITVLYDTVQTLADSVGPALNQPTLINIILPPLIAKWQNLANDDPHLFPLLECLSSVTVALGDGFEQFAPPVYERCVNIMASTLTQAHEASLDPTLDYPDTDFLVTALDLVSGLLQGLGGKMDALIARGNPPLMQLLSMCMQSEVAEVRQSAYGLLGDVTIHAFQYVKPLMPQIMPCVIAELTLERHTSSVCNNAAWVSGEIALQEAEGMATWMAPLMERLLALLRDPKSPPTVSENAAISIGRLGLVCPDLVAPHIPLFASKFIEHLQHTRDNEEKDTAFQGLCTVVSKNPDALFPFFPDFVRAATLFRQPSPALAHMFSQILQGFKPIYPDWNRLVQCLDDRSRSALAHYDV